MAEHKSAKADANLLPKDADATPVPGVPALRASPTPPAPAPAPVAKRRYWFWGLAAVVVVGLGALAYTQFWMTKPTLVAIETATLAPITRLLAVNGQIAAVHSVDVRSVVTGSLVLLPVAEGDHVEANQILAQVDPAAQIAVVRQARAQLDAALVAKKLASETYARAVSLGSNVARAELEADAHDVETATQEVVRTTALLDQDQIVLDSYTIRAAVAGTVLQLNTDQGQLVGPTVSLLTIADLGDLVVEADVDEAYAVQIAQDQRALLQLAGETPTRDGHVSFVSTRVDEATGGLAIKISFDAPVIAPVGLTVATNIIVEERDAALSIPRAAMVTGATGAGVYLAVDGVARLRPVTVVEWPAARLIVTEGLAEGDVVIADATGITDGQAVKVDQP